jgi:hypothetical protein
MKAFWAFDKATLNSLVPANHTKSSWSSSPPWLERRLQKQNINGARNASSIAVLVVEDKNSFEHCSGDADYETRTADAGELSDGLQAVQKAGISFRFDCAGYWAAERLEAARRIRKLCPNPQYSSWPESSAMWCKALSLLGAAMAK